ncbi:hypothetical protein ABZ260_33580 [Streptosporangium sp. NPDC006013]
MGDSWFEPRDPDAIPSRATATLDHPRPVALILSGVTGHIADYAEA